MFNRLAGGEVQRKASDDVLLLMSMIMMVGVDGMVEQEELATLEQYFRTLPEFKGKNFQTLVVESQKLFNKFGGNARTAVNALSGIQNDAVRKKCFILAADIAMSSGDVDEAEDALLESMQRVLNVNDDLARKTVEVLQLKYRA